METKERLQLAFITFFTMGASMVYLYIRYHHFRGLDVNEYFLFTLNKSLSFSGLVLLVYSYIMPTRCDISAESRHRQLLLRGCGLMGFYMIIGHIVMSVFLSTPKYYPHFFEARGGFTWNFVFLYSTGIMALILMAILWIASFQPAKRLAGIPWPNLKEIGYGIFALTAIHSVVQSIHKWTTPQEWPGGLPPLSILSFFIALIPIALKINQVLSVSSRRNA
ncbi:MAG: hypothetical protein JJU28_01870 [Cyclobacteriaceae bacterium]|nr:hypothetical protein [Cyclobacteriaceae bacterium]